MIFLIIDDEHELYNVMMADLFKQNKYEVHEIKRVKMPKYVKKLHDLHYSRRVNKFFEMPFKSIWDKWYELDKYPFIDNEEYTIIFMNGTLRNYYNKRYLCNIKKEHHNVRLCLLIFDKSIYYGAKRAIKMRKCFDYVFSFDEEDCKEYGFLKFYNCFSLPNDLYIDNNKENNIFFAGNSRGRLDALQSCFKHISSSVDNCRFFITGVDKEKQMPIKGVTYNTYLSFHDEMLFSYNSNCLVEILREGQMGISLRVCEAVAFNKKLLSNNQYLSKEPFYDERYMKIFTTLNDIDVDFINRKEEVKYRDNNFFSPLLILESIVEKEHK